MKRQDPKAEKLPDGALPEQTERAGRARAERAFKIFSAVFFTVSVVAFLVMVYVYTAKDLTFSPYLPAFLSLAFGFGLGFGMLFRTFEKRDDNVSSINYFFKIAFSFLILLTALVTFLTSLLRIIHTP